MLVKIQPFSYQWRLRWRLALCSLSKSVIFVILQFLRR